VAGARGCVIHHVASVRELSGVLRRMAEQVVKMKGSLWITRKEGRGTLKFSYIHNFPKLAMVSL
jgi:hypothetical protein